MANVSMKDVCGKIVSACVPGISRANLLGSSFASPPMSEESLAFQGSVNATNSVSTLSELPNGTPTIQIDPPSHMLSNECLSSCSFLHGGLNEKIVISVCTYITTIIRLNDVKESSSCTNTTCERVMRDIDIYRYDLEVASPTYCNRTDLKKQERETIRLNHPNSKQMLSRDFINQMTN
uniref:Uncharacterized protein n=1 Tax=Glossina austeni TaxID=7395 RepID=A0A1A9VGP2_GLOAU